MAIYNTKLKRERTEIDCLSCPYFNKRHGQCNGLGKVCFEIDTATKTLIDPVSGLAIKLKEN